MLRWQSSRWIAVGIVMLGSGTSGLASKEGRRPEWPSLHRNRARSPRTRWALEVVVIGLLATVLGTAVESAVTGTSQSPGQASVPVVPSHLASPFPFRTNPEVVHLSTRPAVQPLYHVLFVTHPASCSIHLDLQVYYSGWWSNDTSPGEHTISASSCQGEAFGSWASSAGTLGSEGINATSLDVTSNGTLTANYVTGYNVTFNETGLVLGAQWMVNLTTPEGTASQMGTTSSIVFVEANGTFNYSIARFTIWAAVDSGSVHVAGRGVTVNVHFTSIVYSVTFESSGLPSETTWSVTLNSTRSFSISSWMGFAQVNGTYSFTIWPVAGYHSNRTGGTVVVSGHPQNISVAFAPDAAGGTSPLSWAPYAVGGTVGVAGIAGATWAIVRRKRAPPAG